VANAEWFLPVTRHFLRTQVYHQLAMTRSW
jgi:hypothetical protein